MDIGYKLTKNCPGCNPGNDKAELEIGFLNWDLLKNKRQEFRICSDFWLKDITRHGSHYFKKLINLWILFNGWLTMLIESESKNLDFDWFLVGTAGWDRYLIEAFKNKRANDDKFESLILEFTSRWPIISNRGLKKYNLEPWDIQGENRVEFTKRFHDINEKPKHTSPRCFYDHRVDQHAPLDWAHVLQAIYGVRCDLFHGGKTHINDPDKYFVKHAFEILWAIWGEEQLS